MTETENKLIEKYFCDAEWKFSFDKFFNPCFYFLKNGKLCAMIWPGSDHLQFRRPVNEFPKTPESVFAIYFKKMCGCSSNREVGDFLGRFVIQQHFEQ